MNTRATGPRPSRDRPPRPSRDRPPTQWGPVGTFLVDEQHGIYATPDPQDTTGGQHLVWHWCPARERWLAAGMGDHRLVSRSPLELSPSLFLPDCCRLHGFIRAGRWVGA